jgi:hypothetical protein
VHDCKLKIVGFDAPSVKIGRQVAAQCRDKAPWAIVDVNPDGTLIDPLWHKGLPTELEKNRIEHQKIAARFKNVKRVEKETEAFRRQRRSELGL